MTDSMKRAIAETDRRRNKQIAYNKTHNITPIGVIKGIKDMIDGVYDADGAQQVRKAAQDEARYEAMSEKQLARELRALEKQMHDHARNLDFEKAAKARDQLAELKKRVFGVALAATDEPLES
jgi:excinuclease ABC subunit B